MRTITTRYTEGQQYFCLPPEIYEKLGLVLEIENQRKGWRRNEYNIFIRPTGKKKKTDRTIKVTSN